MKRSAVYVTITATFLGLCAGLFLGINTGLYWADRLGPKAACEAYRLSVYDCSTFTHQR